MCAFSLDFSKKLATLEAKVWFRLAQLRTFEGRQGEKSGGESLFFLSELNQLFVPILSVLVKRADGLSHGAKDSSLRAPGQSVPELSGGVDDQEHFLETVRTGLSIGSCRSGKLSGPGRLAEGRGR